jgi:hypothetical protein
MNILPRDLVEGNKYKKILVSGGVEYPQATGVYRGRNGEELIWENTDKTGKTETKRFPANSLVYRNAQPAGTRKFHRRKNKRNNTRRAAN